MSCNCNLTVVPTPNGITVKASIIGDFSWNVVVQYPGLQAGDPNGPVSDKNPIAVFQDLIGKLTETMKQEGIVDSNSDPNICQFDRVDRIDAIKFQWSILKVAEKLLEIGTRLASTHTQKKFDGGKMEQSWRFAQSHGKKGQNAPKSSP